MAKEKRENNAGHGEQGEEWADLSAPQEAEESLADVTSQPLTEQLRSIASEALASIGKELKDFKSEEFGVSFSTVEDLEYPEYFVPHSTVKWVCAHPEILLEDGVEWHKMRVYKGMYQIDEDRYSHCTIEMEGASVKLCRKDSSISTRSIELARGYPIEEGINAERLGNGDPHTVSDKVSFRVPKHYLVAPHGVIMEFIEVESVAAAIKPEERSEKDRDDILKNYQEFADFLSDQNEGSLKEFWIPYEPLRLSDYGVRMVYLDNHNSATEASQFILTDMKER